MAVIGTIRQRLGGLLIVLIAFAMLAFILMDMGGAKNGPQRAGTALLKVNGEEIPYRAFEDRLKANEQFMLQNLIQQGQLEAGSSLSEQQREMVRSSTYNEMLGETLKNETYKKLGIQVDDEEQKALFFVDEFQHPSIKSSFADETGKFSQQRFEQYIKTLGAPDPSSGLTPEESRARWANFERAIFQERKDNKYNALIEKSTNIPNWMAKQMLANNNATANIEYVYLPYNSIDDATISVSDAELKKYIETHKEAYQQDASANIKYVVYPIKPSQEDINEVNTWVNNKFNQWKEAENDSLFVMANSEKRWDGVYYKENELMNSFATNMFTDEVGTFYGPTNSGETYDIYKLVDRKAIPDSLKARHLLLTGEGLQSQEEFLNLLDSLTNLVEKEGVPLASLTAQFSNDKANANNGGDLGWVTPGQMVAPFNNAIFYDMNVGDVKTVYTEFGVHLVEVYQWGTTSPGVKVATLQKTVFASEKTTNDIYAEASLFAGNNQTKEAFNTNAKEAKDAPSVLKTANTIQGLQGNARELVKWAFENEAGKVSAPFIVGDNFVVALLNGKSEKGLAALENVRAIVEADVMKDKKAEQLKAKLNSKDLNSLASNNNTTVKTANALSFNNVTLAGVGNEPKVAGAALGLANNAVSNPIQGENGVFVVKTTSKTDAPEVTDLSAVKTRSSSYASGVQVKVFDALKEAAKIEDNSFSFY